jgi:hypothetical protein
MLGSHIGETQPGIPELKQINTLTPAEFERHPVWVGVHNMDSGKPWYDLADEGTYRPWTDSLPAPERGFVLVTAKLILHDESVYSGFVTAAAHNWDAPPPPRRMKGGGISQARSHRARHGDSPLVILGFQQRTIFVNGRQFHFWGGMRGVAPEKRAAFYSAIGKPPEAIFPLQFIGEPNLSTGIVTGQVDGFYRSIWDQPPECER